MSEEPVVLTNYIPISRQQSLDTYLDEWRYISRQSRILDSNENEDEKDEQGIYTNSDAIWLEKLGFGNYVSQLETGDGTEVTEDAYLKNAGLSRHHAHAIRRRMNTLRSTVRSRKKKEEDHESIRTDSPILVGSKQLNSARQGATPTSSPQASPIPSRRSPSSYNVTSTEQSSRRNGRNIDSGVYSANSSRDGTPVRGQQTLIEGSSVPTPIPRGSSEINQRSRTKVLTHSSPLHTHTGSKQNGTSLRHGLSKEIGEGVYLDDYVSKKSGEGSVSELSRHKKINPTSLNLVSRPIDTGPVLHNSKNRSKRLDVSSSLNHRRRRDMEENTETVRRHSSERHISSGDRVKSSSHQDVTKPETRQLPSGRGEVRSVSPSMMGSRGGRGEISPFSSPQDIKLDFANGTQNMLYRMDETQNLPNFMISPDALGITRINDLSPQDMERVRSVALLELTVTFDDHDIPLRSRRPARAKNYPENALLGVPLNVLLQADQKRDPYATIPLIFEEMISYLENHALDNEGLLRVPGSSARVNSLLQDLEVNFHSGQFSFSDLKPNDVCSMLKQFIRELPVPLLTREYLPAFSSIADISDLKEQVRTLNLLILLLPDLNQKVLKRLLELFEKIIQHSATNKMDLTNVAMVIAPNLFMRLPARQTLDDVTVAGKTSHIVRLLIKYHNLLWTIPGEMLRQIRYLYENEVRRLNPRSIQRAIKQMQHQLMEQQHPNRGIVTPEVSHHIIRVKAPLFTRVCMAVDICVGVTAGDIITKLQKKSRLNNDVIRKRFSSSSITNIESWPRLDSSVECLNQLKLPEEVVDAGEQFLFEVGGNICERCLPNDTDMYSLYSVNPNAQWIIKPRNCPDLN